MSDMSEKLNWFSWEGPATVALADGGFMRTYRFRGRDISTLDQSERLQISERLNDAFRQLGDRWGWHIEAQNTEVTGYPRSRWPNVASALFDAERAADLAPIGSQYEMRHYVTLTQKAPRKGAELLTRLIASGVTDDERKRQRDAFLRQTDDIARLLRGVLDVRAMDDDDVATYLHNSISTHWHRVSAADHDLLSQSLPDCRFVRGWKMHMLGDHYLSMLTLGGFPLSAQPQMLAALSRFAFRFRWVTRWIGMNRVRAKDMLSKREDNARGASEGFLDALIRSQRAAKNGGPIEAAQKVDREALGWAEEAAEAQRELATRDFGHMTSVFIVTDPDKDVCARKRDEIASLLRSLRFVVRDESVEPVKLWRMSLPGNLEMGRRTYPLKSRNVADLMPASSVWQGAECDERLAKATGCRRPWLYTADPVPFRLNTDVEGGAAHTVVFGATGQGRKSTLSNALCYQFQAYPKAQIVSLSVGRSELGPVVLSGGAIYSIGARDSLEFQPLAEVHEANEALVTWEWLQLCLQSQGVPVTPERREKLSTAIKLRAADHPMRRTMTALVANLQNLDKEAAAALRIYTKAGQYGHIFDGDNGGALEWKRWTMFDVGRLVDMRPEATAPIVSHLLHIVSRRYGLGPTLVVCDEFPAWLHLPLLEKAVANIIDTKRKDDVRALMIAQTPGQLAKYPDLMTSIKSGCATAIYGKDSRATTMANSYAEFEVTPVELQTIAKLPEGSYYLKNMRGTREFNLRLGDIGLALANPDNRTLLAELRHTCSADEALAAVLERAGLTAKAKGLRVWDAAKVAKKVA